MSQTILLLDYEPRTVLRVTEALQPLGCEVTTAKDVDSAVNACAKVEPKVVLITSVLPRLKVEDAITQLRARAGLRATPFLILMSGYTGQDPEVDAGRIGAQDIVAKPFSNEHLLARVKILLQKSRPDGGVSPDTRADVLEALRRSAGLPREGGTVTSEELFGDLFNEESDPSPAETQRIRLAPATEPVTAVGAAPAKPAPAPVTVPESDKPVDAAPEPAKPGPIPVIRPEPPKQAPGPVPARPMTRRMDSDTAVDRALETTLADMRQQAKPKVREDTGGASVDALLSQTLSGLELKVPGGASRPPKPAEKPPERPAEKPVVRPVEKPVVKPLEKPAEPPARQAVPTGRPVPPSAPPDPGPVGTPFGQYDLIAPIATGGMAEVFKARMRGVEGFQKIVAIKRILPHLTDNDEFVTMFIDEAKLAAQLQHPNIIHIYDLGKLERSYYIAMEYIDGKDLRSILRVLDEKQRRLPLGLALYIASRLCEALDYAHRRRDMQGREMALVHRDVSPQNVLISFDGDIKLCDFGIAKAASKASHTRAGALKGKLQYMSPEQAWGKDLDHRSDIFSVGLVLYDMLTGRKAFAGDSELSILEQVRSPHIATARDVDPAIPPEVERVVLKALKENREERYQTAGEMAVDLNAILQSLRPAPGAGELGTFLTEQAGRDRATGAPAAPASRPATTPPPPREAPPVVLPKSKPAPPPAPVPAHFDVSEVISPQRKFPVALVAGVAVVVVAVVLAIIFLAREKKTTGDAGVTPTPPLAAAVGTAIASATGATPVPGGVETSTPVPTAQPAVLPTQAPVIRPTEAPTRPAAAPTVAAVAPTARATATALPQVAVPTPVAEPPTPAPIPPTAAPIATRPPLASEQPTVAEGQLVGPGPDVVEPIELSNPMPTRPPVARAQNKWPTGVIILQVLVEHTGTVEKVQLLRGLNPDFGFNEAAVETVKTWRFKPATKTGVRVRFNKTITLQPRQFKP
jgi:TonB family protein